MTDTITPICGRHGCGNALNQRHRYRAVDFCSYECVELERQSDGYYSGGEVTVYDPATRLAFVRRRVQ